jgi:NADH dehydrogenase
MNKMKKIVVVGSGFGGLQFVNHLKNGQFDIMVIDKINHQGLQRLFNHFFLLPKRTTEDRIG